MVGGFRSRWSRAAGVVNDECQRIGREWEEDHSGAEIRGYQPFSRRWYFNGEA